jgi:hypothetical protein
VSKQRKEKPGPQLEVSSAVLQIMGFQNLVAPLYDWPENPELVGIRATSTGSTDVTVDLSGLMLQLRSFSPFVPIPPVGAAALHVELLFPVSCRSSSVGVIQQNHQNRW